MRKLCPIKDDTECRPTCGWFDETFHTCAMIQIGRLEFPDTSAAIESVGNSIDNLAEATQNIACMIDLFPKRQSKGHGDGKQPAEKENKEV
jgi:hypothetical protein